MVGAPNFYREVGNHVSSCRRESKVATHSFQKEEMVSDCFFQVLWQLGVLRTRTHTLEAGTGFRKVWTPFAWLPEVCKVSLALTSTQPEGSCLCLPPYSLKGHRQCFLELVGSFYPVWEGLDVGIRKPFVKRTKNIFNLKLPWFFKCQCLRDAFYNNAYTDALVSLSVNFLHLLYQHVWHLQLSADRFYC